ncbi:3-deoxy-D-manno-octulosonic acid transferase [Phaeobacter gallaeciensis]|uniref:3-deoxy-D-manno-octulosonic acid transferase n=1 Tax=Phaeobacter gallaeciensis TaxID=60890 RepID=A0AAC9Z9L6_9RHOB|nr:3-deoxy-D-manno-octulosonic acid transferase [Phaeobacter gallaeciensis]AHD10218.1 3-deoxy-D-manno-octulosonic-acid transferase [Phaeobacter gallaeciensis DSM 26640]ATE93482.1 3-deoxy-D-manno-octulosonic-acid transferase [Phaeobacter gallaeciensis]ATE96697.1 3-deoxy-D-manno-octulosonic-acid transferase [Phaeobacter gallaeciensis]ATF02146.1 3-deoxy-D-manno-octulosonic-acid transferase [Phaeobacter gallaeciensis]ATF06526.1 3-deoxy-D-manno-octulosonic-acid transferase [Phaeobacter gallaeciensi
MTSPRTSAPSLLFHLYRGITAAVTPFAYRKVAGKLANHGVSPARQRERLGYASQPRPTPQTPDGHPAPLIWFHGASVGESLAALSLIDKLSPRLPGAEFLLTSGTASSAEMMAKRMPGHCRHQFAPLDATAPVRRFLRHWQPDAALFVESELWPVTLDAAKRSGVRLALVNARLSARSIARWKSKPATAAFVMQHFDVLLSQNPQMGQSLTDLGAPADRVHPSGNLKAGSAPLPVDQTVLASVQAELGARPVWIASSTHRGEEETVIAAHKALLAETPNLCLLLAPRHPERADEIAALIEEADLSVARRSAGDALTPDTQVYLADTLGEVGTWYALSPIVFLGGSLAPIGGHNPFEVAQAGAAVITGPGYSNFAETYPPLIDAGGAVEVSDAPTLAGAVQHWLTDDTALNTARTAARGVVEAQAAALDGVVDLLISQLALAPTPRDN